MPIGIIIAISAVFFGGIFGVLLGRYVPERISSTLNLMFGLCSLAMGVSQVVGVSALAPLVLAVIIGTTLGTGVNLERNISKAAGKLQGPLNALLKGDGITGLAQAEWMSRYVAAVVLFCASGTGIYGALQEGLAGDPSILITKAVLDFFTALIFACDLGIMLPLIALPEAVIMFALFTLAGAILPLTNDAMIANFKAMGGILMLATGFRITRMREFPVADMLPAMIFVMPFTWAYITYVAPLLG